MSRTDGWGAALATAAASLAIGDSLLGQRVLWPDTPRIGERRSAKVNANREKQKAAKKARKAQKRGRR